MYPLEESHRAVPDRRSSQVWSTARRWLAGDRTHSRRDRPQPTVETLEGRVLLSLTPVPRNARFPFTTIVELRTTMPNGESYLGSGVMVDQFHVLTVGHIVYDAEDGGFARRIVATPDLYGSRAPYGTARMTKESTFDTWISYSQATRNDTTSAEAMDIALITLNRRIGKRTGWMSLGVDDNLTPGTILNAAGYPAGNGYTGKYMYVSAGPIAGLSAGGGAILYYHSSITTYAGQSGGPVWAYTPSTGSRVVYAVVAGRGTSPNSLNFATRITSAIFTKLLQWRSADKAPRSLAASASIVTAKAGPLTGPRTAGHAQFQSQVHLAALEQPLPYHSIDTQGSRIGA